MNEHVAATLLEEPGSTMLLAAGIFLSWYFDRPDASLAIDFRDG